MEHYLSLSTIQAIEKFVYFMKDNPDIQNKYDEYLKKANENYLFDINKI